MATDKPIPKDPRHQRFADLLIEGRSHTDAYLEAGYNVAREVARTNGGRLRKRPAVVKYMTWVQERAAEASVLLVAEKREFLARIVRTPITALNPTDPHDPNNCLIKKLTKKVIREGAGEDAEEFEVITLEKLDPLKAIDLDNKLSGDDPEATGIQQLAAAVAALGHASVLPTETM